MPQTPLIPITETSAPQVVSTMLVGQAFSRPFGQFLSGSSTTQSVRMSFSSPTIVKNDSTLVTLRILLIPLLRFHTDGRVAPGGLGARI